MKNSLYNFQTNINGQDFLYNTLSGQLIRLVPAISECMSGHLSDNQLQAKLANKGFLVDDDINEEEIVKGLYLQRRFSSKIYELILNTSLDCNLNCWYCYETHLPKSHMTLELVQRVLKHLDIKHQTCPFEILKLSFFGGEPMINYKAISALLHGIERQASSKGFKVELLFVTNGTFINERYVDLLKPFKTKFQITIDGNKETHNSIRKFKNKNNQDCYGHILDGIKLLNDAKADFYFTLRINYDEKVLEHIDTLINDISFLNRKRSIISLQRVWQCKPENISISTLFKTIEMINNAKFCVNTYSLSKAFNCCYADNLNQAVINYNGQIFKCTARDFTKEKSYGNLNSLGFIEWDTELLKKRLSIEIPQKCQKCKLLPCCPGICSQKIIENKNSDNIHCPFDKRLSHEDILLLNIKQQIIAKSNENN